MTPKVLLVGWGSIGRRHLRVIRSVTPKARIMVLRHGVVIENVDLADVTTSSFSDVEAFKPELAVIANPASLHAEMAQRLLAMHCHLLIEKPLASAMREGKSILAAAQSNDRVVHVGYNLRYLYSLQLFRDQIRKGVVGRVLSIRCEVGQFLGSWRADADYRQGVSARKDMGGGVLLELSHELDYLSWIFGRIEWVSAWLGHQSDLEIDVEDTVHLILGFQADSPLSPVASLSLDFIRHDTTRRCLAICDSGSIVWDAVRGSVELFLKGDTNWRVLHQSTPERDFSYTAQWEGFVSAVASETNRPDPVAADLEQSIHVLQVVESARKSAVLNGARVNLGGREPDGQ